MKKRIAKIYLFRHGQTHFNKAKRFTGWLDSTWTGVGSENARATAEKLKNCRIDVGFSSHLKRSKATLGAVLKYHDECKLVIVDDRMIERCYGDLQGRSHAAFIREQGKELFDKYHRAYDFPPPNGESVRMVGQRVLPFIRDLLAFIKMYGVNVAISAHGNSMRPFRCYFEHLSVGEMMELENPYDDFFEYNVPVSVEREIPSKSAWKAVRLPLHVKKATDQHNVLKRYY